MLHNIVAFCVASATLAALASAPASASIVLYDGDYSVEEVFRLPAQQSQSGISFGPGRSITYSSFEPRASYYTGQPGASAGIYQLTPSGQRRLVAPAGGVGVTRDRNGTMYLSGVGWSTNIMKVRPNGDIIELVPSSVGFMFSDLALSSDGSRLWASTYSGMYGTEPGIYEVNIDTGSLTKIFDALNGVVAPLQMTVSRSDEIYFTNANGLNKLVSGKPVLILPNPDRDFDPVCALHFCGPFLDLELDPLGGFWLTSTNAPFGVLYHFDALDGLAVVGGTDEGEYKLAYDWSTGSGALALGGQLLDWMTNFDTGAPITVLRTPYRVPEPGAGVLLTLAVACLYVIRHRRLE